MFKSISRRFQAWRRYSAAMNELSHLSDRELEREFKQALQLRERLRSTQHSG